MFDTCCTEPILTLFPIKRFLCCFSSSLRCPALLRNSRNPLIYFLFSCRILKSEINLFSLSLPVHYSWDIAIVVVVVLLVFLNMLNILWHCLLCCVHWLYEIVDNARVQRMSVSVVNSLMTFLELRSVWSLCKHRRRRQQRLSSNWTVKETYLGRTTIWGL